MESVVDRLGPQVPGEFGDDWTGPWADAEVKGPTNGCVFSWVSATGKASFAIASKE